MANSAYHFVTHWRVKGTCVEVADVLENTKDLARWWPSVYLGVSVLDPGGTHALGERVSLFTKGWLPYTLRWDFTVVEQRYPYGSTIEARGDFVGRGEWTFEQDGDFVNVTYDWNISRRKTALANAHAAAAPDLFRQSPLGHGSGRAEPGTRACAPAREERRRARRYSRAAASDVLSANHCQGYVFLSVIEPLVVESVIAAPPEESV